MKTAIEPTKKESDKVFKSLEEKKNILIAEGECYKKDILSDWENHFSGINAIITSPPFVASTKFYMTNWMRFWFAGWGKNDFQETTESFVEVKQKKNIDIYIEIFKKFSKVLADDGVIVFHTGKNQTLDMAKILASKAKGILNVEDIFIECVAEGEKHGLKDKGGTTEHQYIIMTKTS